MCYNLYYQKLQALRSNTQSTIAYNSILCKTARLWNDFSGFVFPPSYNIGFFKATPSFPQKDLPKNDIDPKASHGLLQGVHLKIYITQG